MPNRANVSVEVCDVAAARLAAANLGLTIGRGRMADDGSIRKMLNAIATGEALIMLHNYDFPEGMRRDAALILEEAEKMERAGNLSLASVLRGLSAALENAADLKEE